MRVVATSDWHLDWVTRGVTRRDEVERAVQQSIAYAVERATDLYLFTGDLCDPDDGGVVARSSEYAVHVARDLSRRGIPSAWIAGNHDTTDDGVTTSLTPLRRLADPLVSVHEQPGIRDLGQGRVLVALPHTAFGAAEHSPQALTRLLPRLAGFRTIIFACHLTVPGIVPGEETTEMPRGRDLTLPLDALDEFRTSTARWKDPPAIVVINGHYHRAMCHAGVLVPGSLARLTFGEEEHVPSFLDVWMEEH